MENCKNCKYCLNETYYVCAVTDCIINSPILMGGSKKCVCYKRAEKKKDKFVYPALDKLESYLQSIGEIQGDLF